MTASEVRTSGSEVRLVLPRVVLGKSQFLWTSSPSGRWVQSASCVIAILIKFKLDTSAN